MKSGVACALCLLVSAVSSEVTFAHHSTALFDYSQSKALQGSVRSFHWGNPHSYVQLITKDSKGAPQEWAIEAGVPSAMSQLGWSKDTLKPGDTVTIVVAPMRDGSASGSLKSVTLADGKELLGVASLLGDGPAPTFPTLKRATPKQP